MDSEALRELERQAGVEPEPSPEIVAIIERAKSEIDAIFARRALAEEG